MEEQLENESEKEYEPNRTWLLRVNYEMLRLKIEEKKLAIKMVSKTVKRSLLNAEEKRIMNMEACSEYKKRRLMNFFKEEQEDLELLMDYYELQLVTVAALLDFRRIQDQETFNKKLDFRRIRDQETFKKLDYYNQGEFKTRSLPCLNNL